MIAELPVLVGIDGSSDGLIALRWAASYAALREAPLHAVLVVDDATEIQDDTLEELRRRVAPTAEGLEIRRGHPADVLFGMSTRAQALVIGRRGVGGFAELVLGSTSRVCPPLSTDVPLLVVPSTWDPTASPHGRIVVGIDGSLEGQEAVRFAFELADATNSEILGVHAVEVHEAYPAPSPSTRPCTDAADELLTATLAGWKAKYPEVSVHHRCAADHPVLVLVRESRKADLVVVGGIGRTAFSELRIGPVARGLLYHSHSPVAVVHPT